MKETDKRTGHSSTVGKPKVLLMADICASSESPANRGLRRNSSATMQPTWARNIIVYHIIAITTARRVTSRITASSPPLPPYRNALWQQRSVSRRACTHSHPITISKREINGVMVKPSTTDTDTETKSCSRHTLHHATAY